MSIRTLRPSVQPKLLQPLQERCVAGLPFRIVLDQVREHADAPHPVGLLRTCREWPRRRCATDERDELASSHSITSSARAISVGGTSRPSAFAVLRLMTNSNLVGCSIGNSEAFAPLRILTTYAAARRLRSGTFGP